MESEREAARRAIKRRNWLAHLWREWIVESRRPIAPVFARPTPDTWSNENLTAAWIDQDGRMTNPCSSEILIAPSVRCWAGKYRRDGPAAFHDPFPPEMRQPVAALNRAARRLAF